MSCVLWLLLREALLMLPRQALLMLCHLENDLMTIITYVRY